MDAIAACRTNFLATVVGEEAPLNDFLFDHRPAQRSRRLFASLSS